MAEPVLFCWSGGKDSCLALYELRRDPLREVVALLTTVTEGYDRISMHGVRRELLERQAASLGLPLEIVTIPPGCVNTEYEARMEATLLKWKARGIFRLRPRVLTRSAFNAAASVAVTGSPLWPVPS